MSTAQHTPGPWAYADAAWDATNTAYTVYGAAKLLQPVADVLKTANAHANARLIAAAPDLLAALEDALSIFNPEPPDAHPAPKWEARAIAAIAKATGGAL